MMFRLSAAFRTRQLGWVQAERGANLIDDPGIEMLMLSEKRQHGMPVLAVDCDDGVAVRAALLIMGIEAAPALRQPLPEGGRFHDGLLLEVPNV